MAKDVGSRAMNGTTNRPTVRKNGHKVTERLEEDAQNMEARLHQLRSNLQEEKQKLEAERPTKYGGSRWRSASETRGSISKYAKEVQERTTPTGKKKSDKSRKCKDESLSSGRSPASGSQPAAGILSTATCAEWTTGQVQQWIQMIGLDEFHSAFEFHQVTGDKLLALTPTDCANFGVDKLSSRNRLIVEVENLRSRTPVNNKHLASQCAEILDPAIRDAPPVPELPSPTQTHWSHLKPLKEENAAASNEEAPVNLADGEFDEDAGHASFMKALLEWRECDNNTASAQENQESEWVNPIFGGEEEITGGGTLLEGSYDEAKAHEQFLLALEAWRRGGDGENPPADQPTESRESVETGCAPDERKSCWQCYRVELAERVVVDPQTSKVFCSLACQSAFQKEYARFYNK